MLKKNDVHTDKVILSDNDSDEQDTEQNGKTVNEQNKQPSQPLHHRDDDDICEMEHLRKLFIGGLASYTTEESLRDFYGQWGKVVDVVVMRDKVTKRSRGFGFITFIKSSMVDKAQDNRPHVIDGKTVEAKRSLPRPERETRETNISVKKLFVGGLKDNHDEDCLEEYFSQFGKVVSVKILTDKTTGKRRGFAFIEFDDYDAVDKAILKKTHQIKYVVVDVKKSVYNHEKQQRGESNSNIMLAGDNGSQKPPPNYGGQHQQPQSSGYGPPAAQGPPPPYQQPPPMHAAPPAPNYNYWGPPPPAMPPQQYGGGGYQQPPAPQMNNWNYAPAPNGWNQGPPPPPTPGPVPNWHTANQWGGPPPAGPPQQATAAVPVRPPPNGNWNVPPVQAPAVPPVGPPPQQQQAPPPAHNFGNGYQQNYGGGPTKQHGNMNANRMNPYGAPPNAYANNTQQPPAAAYGPYNGAGGSAQPSGMPPVNAGPAPVPKPMSNRAPPQGNNKFRR